MNCRTRVVGLMTIMALVLCPTTLLALVGIIPTGIWPDFWPKELEPYRGQAKTLQYSTYVAYEIRFQDREDFEKAWPYIVKLKSKGAPLILEKAPSTYSASTLDIGVRILSPPTNIKTLLSDDGSLMKPGPPWPEYLRSPTGELPEYACTKGGKWVPCYHECARLYHFVRARQDIMLVCDGEVIDLNRIPIPPDTPIIDRRFEEQAKPSHAK